MLTDFTIRNFRGIKELTLPSLKRVNLFVGKNGVGKTSVLEALELWARDASPDAIWRLLADRQESISGGDLAQTLRRLFNDPAEPAGLQLSAGNESANFQLSGLTYRHDASEFQSLTTDFPTKLRSERARVLFFPARGLQIGMASLLWERVASHRWDPAAAVRAAIPELEDIIVVPRGSSTVVPFIGTPGSAIRFPINAMGDGAVRLWELALALVNSRNGMLLVDEIENGLHYSALNDMWRYVLSVAAELNVQVFATTHSRDAVYALAEASKEDDHMVYRLSRRDGPVQAVPFDNKRLEYVVGDQLEIR